MQGFVPEECWGLVGECVEKCLRSTPWNREFSCCSGPMYNGNLSIAERSFWPTVCSLLTVQKMSKDGSSEDCSSHWSAAVVLVTKRDGTTRFCVDYSKLTDVTRKVATPRPRLDDTPTTLAGSAIFNDEAASSTGNGFYQFTAMPFWRLRWRGWWKWHYDPPCGSTWMMWWLGYR